MGIKVAIRAVVPARSKSVHAARFTPGSSTGTVLCNDRLAQLPLARLALERVSCKGCQAELDTYETAGPLAGQEGS